MPHGAGSAVRGIAPAIIMFRAGCCHAIDSFYSSSDNLPSRREQVIGPRVGRLESATLRHHGGLMSRDQRVANEATKLVGAELPFGKLGDLVEQGLNGLECICVHKKLPPIVAQNRQTIDAPAPASARPCLPSRSRFELWLSCVDAAAAGSVGRDLPAARCGGCAILGRTSSC